MTDTKHTPAPWKAEHNDHYWTIVPESRSENDPYQIGDVCSSYPGEMNQGLQQANAAHIVKCVNMHDELVEALEGMLKYIPDGIVECRGDKCREPWCASCCGFEAAEFALDQIRFDYQRSKVAIAKARGEEL